MSAIEQRLRGLTIDNDSAPQHAGIVEPSRYSRPDSEIFLHCVQAMSEDLLDSLIQPDIFNGRRPALRGGRFQEIRIFLSVLPKSVLFDIVQSEKRTYAGKLRQKLPEVHDMSVLIASG